LRIVNITFSRRGRIASGRDVAVSARFTISVPSGPDQLADLSLKLVQDDKIIGRAHKGLTLDEGELNKITLKLTAEGRKFDEGGPEPRFEIQLVNQDENRDVEQGGFFWWFTVPIPL
jgi:hypothetical protein